MSLVALVLQVLQGQGEKLGQSFILASRLCMVWRAAIWSQAPSQEKCTKMNSHPTEDTVLSITCDPSDCFLANNVLDIVIIGVSEAFSRAAEVRPVPINWPDISATSLANRTSAGESPALGPGYRLYRLLRSLARTCCTRACIASAQLYNCPQLVLKL
jgi:hypothetical protein